jgi:membrane protease YdiL (CAAX protease family)
LTAPPSARSAIPVSESSPGPDLLPEQEHEGSTEPQRGAAALMALFEILVCSDFVTQNIIGALLIGGGLRPLARDGRFSPAFFFALSIVDSAVLLALIFFFLHLHRESARDLLIGRRRPKREAWLGVMLVPFVLFLVAVLLLAIQRVAPGLHNVPTNPLEGLIRTPRDALLFGLVVVIAGGLREEIQRAFLLSRFEHHLGGPVIGLVVVTIFFGIGHSIQGWDAVITTATLGAFWGVVYLVRRSVVAPVVSHAGFDVFEILQFALLRNA